MTYLELQQMSDRLGTNPTKLMQSHDPASGRRAYRNLQRISYGTCSHLSESNRAYISCLLEQINQELQEMERLDGWSLIRAYMKTTGASMRGLCEAMGYSHACLRNCMKVSNAFCEDLKMLIQESIEYIGSEITKINKVERVSFEPY